MAYRRRYRKRRYKSGTVRRKKRTFRKKKSLGVMVLQRILANNKKAIKKIEYEQLRSNIQSGKYANPVLSKITVEHDSANPNRLS